MSIINPDRLTAEEQCSLKKLYNSSTVDNSILEQLFSKQFFEQNIESEPEHEFKFDMMQAVYVPKYQVVTFVNGYTKDGKYLLLDYGYEPFDESEIE